MNGNFLVFQVIGPKNNYREFSGSY